MTKYPVVVQEWEESERGWGVRPDGASLHLSEADRVAYVEVYWAREQARNPGGVVPAEYSRPSGAAFVIDIDDDVYSLVKNSVKGVMLLEHAYQTLRKR